MYVVVDTQDRLEPSVTESLEHSLRQTQITDRFSSQQVTWLVTHVWKSVRNQVSKQLVEHHSSLRDNYLARELQFKEITNLRTSVLGFFFFWFCETSRNVMKIGGYVASIQQKSQQLWGQIYRWSMGGKTQTSLLLSRVPGLKNWWRNNKMLW